ncbi:DUF1501 domain-containing protein [Enterovibrio norvegicus]|uniref:DUF1501 domain-containing protein n=1 Tax=Enterovibrio norvegicus TaxID=188144 RepID=UPI003D144470
MKLTRRDFIKSAGIAGAAAAAPMSFSLQARGVEDYKALICIFMNGGNDFFHQVLPLDSENFNKFNASRQGIAVPRSHVMPLNIKDKNGVQFGLNKSMRALMPLFEKNQANVVMNVGALLAPTSKEDLESGRAELPPYLFAHNKQQEVWQHSWMGEAYSQHGWLGMSMDVMARSMADMPNCFYTGPNSILNSYSTDSMFVNKNGFQELQALSSAVIRSSYESMANQHYHSPLVAGYANVVQQAVSAQKQMEPIVEGIPMDDRIPTSNLGTQLRGIKQMIDAAQVLGHNRQVFYVSIGGFDTHDNQVRRQDDLMKEFSEAVAGLYAALEEDGLSENVLTCSLSEFGRTMHDNARKGTDHGWGGGQFMFGGPTHGGECCGEYPDFTRGGKDDNGEGRIIPKIAHEQYAAYMVKWLGLGNGALNTVFPTLPKFGGPIQMGLVSR